MIADFWEIAAVFFAFVREKAVPEWHSRAARGLEFRLEAVSPEPRKRGTPNWERLFLNDLSMASEMDSVPTEPL
jgi:hypothetical protein